MFHLAVIILKRNGRRPWWLDMMCGFLIDRQWMSPTYLQVSGECGNSGMETWRHNIRSRCWHRTSKCWANRIEAIERKGKPVRNTPFALLRTTDGDGGCGIYVFHVGAFLGIGCRVSIGEWHAFFMTNIINLFIFYGINMAAPVSAQQKKAPGHSPINLTRSLP